MVGLGNQTDTGQTIWVKMHYTTPNQLKKVWAEAEILTWGNVIGSVDAAVPEDYQYEMVDQGPDQDLNPGFRVNTLWYIMPNPSWEEVVLQAYVPAHSGALIDKVFVSTACVPEPSALMALGGGLGMLGLAWRRRK